LRDEVIDLVGGRADIDRGVVRAIGDARARFAEDKLRMLRAVRFAATFDFRLEGETRDAIADMAEEIVVVSAERIAQEMRLLLVLPARALGIRLLDEVGLLPVLLPELAPMVGSSAWTDTLAVVEGLTTPSFSLALAAALHRVPSSDESVIELSRRWKLSNKERESAAWLLSHQDDLWEAATIPWPKLQRLLIEPGIEELLALHQAVATVNGKSATGLEYCRQWLAGDPVELNPPPLVSGHDLIEHGLAPGAAFQGMLEQIRDAQLEGKIATRDEALAWADRLHNPGTH
jgi:poly(A) polymerase